MKQRGRCWMAALLTVLLLTGCNTGKTAEIPVDSDNAETINVVTTLFPYYDFARQIAGDKVQLSMVIPAGMDSHSFEPTPEDILTIQNADVLIYNGGEMEHWLEQVLKTLDMSEVTVISMMDYVDTVTEEYVEGMEVIDHDHEEDHDHKEDHDHEADHSHEEDDDDGHRQEREYDEHIWTSPVNAMRMVGIMSEVLQQADPLNASQYEANTKQYLSELKQLDRDFLEIARDKKRNMIIVGDRFPFRYLADEYGFGYRAAFVGCSTDTEPSAKTISYLMEQVKERQIPVVYYLELSSHKVSEVIGEETGALPMLLHSCHNVSRAEFDAGITYVELMKQNVENLRRGLVQ